MSPNPIQRPNKPNSTQRPVQKAKKVIDSSRQNRGNGGGRNHGGGGQGGGNNGRNEPSPWLDENNEPSPTPTASFVEYLRWMRAPDSEYKDETKVQILHLATENANYRERLKQLVKRTEIIAQVTFQVKCPWRIRVGGTKGPENILLPAFDALGMPYIPSATLRGVARNQAIRELMKKQKLTWDDADKKVAPYFGSLEVEEKANRAGKVVFLDAYPVPSEKGGLAMDMANNIWKWEGERPDYSPNPNPFLSLKEPTFLIGLRLATGCQDERVLEKVKTWLIEGMRSGIGSQVNTGYGELFTAGAGHPTKEFFRVEFSLEGQLIHGYKKFTQWNWNDRRNEWQMRGIAEAEVRPVAFKSMLRYWFRAFALGVLSFKQVQEWEAKLFGGIDPKREYGYLKVNIIDGKKIEKEARHNVRGQKESCDKQQGTLVLSLSPEASRQKKEELTRLYKELTWLMFNLGGIGQGARRPCYSREGRGIPLYRGSTFCLDSDDELWTLPNTIQEFQKQFKKRLVEFYHALEKVTEIPLDYHNPKLVGRVTEEKWLNAVDGYCKIIICTGNSDNHKPYALSVLHCNSFKVNADSKNDNDSQRTLKKIYDGNLCGQVKKPVKPSPVWIADLGDYQVVTVFGANVNPRDRYLQELRSRTSRDNYVRVFPL
ncbi:RAMP superfamily CRISPR-associated protein [Oscillatoria sp. FACHB-1406]|uniref:RAMP superfamily CRISPR-associated protein n=1 Tax=Oscillatoria sp. FACHB-1406 TaxID=2692846 RepID=UPI0016865C7F|nr:RAMP superfamily CRISPR-associated protein [Oscillatoria sp. FACHB-1406]MBD2576997.1 type III-B CRISPR module RAMP protein Cmr6 [Oscillatoria sp. FACHB-1406]